MDDGLKCHKETAAEKGPPLVQNGKIIFQTHHIGWIVAGLFALVATVVSFWLVNRHLRWYTNKREQRYIVRILFMVPIYALISFASYLFWNHSTALLLLRDGYESTVLTAFFYLLLMYLSPDPEEQKALFSKFGLSRNADRDATSKGELPKKWVFPLGFIRSKPQDGLYFLQMMKWGVLQYCVIRPTTTLAAVILDYQGLYCEESWGLGWGHIYITTIVSVSVTVAMYCLIQLYVPVSKHLSPHKPLLKLFAIKAVVFLTFWQATFLSLLSLFGVVKDGKYMTAAEINIGIGALLETFEMAVFAFLHIRAFTYQPYVPSTSPKSQEPPTPTPRLRALAHAMDFRETFREIWVGCVYIFDKLRGKEPTPDANARRAVHYEGAFGRARLSQLTARSKFNPDPEASVEKTVPTFPAVEIEIEEHVDVEGERQWLGTGDDYGYGLGYIKRERSEGLGAQIEKELEKRGYATRIQEQGHIIPSRNGVVAGQKRQHSWWRSVYNRISQSGPDMEDLATNDSYQPRIHQHSHFNMPEAKRGLLYDYEFGLDDPLPQRASQSCAKPQSSHADPIQETSQNDILTPLPVFWDPYHHGVSVSSSGRSKPLPGHPALYSPNIPSPQIARSDSLLGRIFPRSVESMPTGILSHRDHQSQTHITSPEDSRRGHASIDTAIFSSFPPQNRSSSSHHAQRRESVSHRPPIHSPPISLITASAPFPVLSTPRRNSSHHGLIVNEHIESPTLEISHFDRYPPFSSTSIPQASQIRPPKHSELHTSTYAHRRLK